MPTTYSKKNKDIDIYDLAEMTGQSVEELQKGFKEAEDDIRCGRVTPIEDLDEYFKELNNKVWDYIASKKHGDSEWN